MKETEIECMTSEENDEAMKAQKEGFRSDLESLINCYSKENGSDTPDHILADYLNDCLTAFDKAVLKRAKWYAPEANELRLHY